MDAAGVMENLWGAFLIASIVSVRQGSKTSAETKSGESWRRVERKGEMGFGRMILVGNVAGWLGSTPTPTGAGFSLEAVDSEWAESAGLCVSLL